MSDYKLSALVSCYASEKFIRGCLQDLTQQTLFKNGNLQIVVIDSCSPEQESLVVQEFKKNHPHIIYHRSIERETLYGAWNTGISLSQGQYITNANTDDRHKPDALERLVDILDSNTGIDLAYANCFCTEKENQHFLEYEGTILYQFKEFFEPEALLHYQFGPQPVWRRAVHDKVGSFNAAFKAAGDWEFNLRFNLANCKAIHLNETLGLFLNSPKSISRSDTNSTQEQANLRKIYFSAENIVKLYNLAGYKITNNKEQAEILNNFALRCSFFKLPWEPEQTFSDFDMASKAILEAIKLMPQSPELICNLANILAISGKKSDALMLYEKLPYKSDSILGNISFIQNNLLGKLQFYSNISFVD